ncbi:MAG: hypothetical protein QOD30_349 [Actinomycetota bacterium]|jgi:AcrR family transcriptional regulator|nr:hypothetical protein [Actinomycetota bacterium]
MDLRDRQRAATRDQIIDAVHVLLTEEHPATLSMAQVAERAGTSLRTLYRYFPTKEALVEAASESFQVPADVIGGRVTLATLPTYLHASWTGFTASIGAIRAQHLSPAGRTIRLRRVPRSRRAVRSALESEHLPLSDDDQARLADLLIALISSSMYLELVDRLGHHDEDAVRLAAWAVTAAVEKAAREGAVAP